MSFSNNIFSKVQYLKQVSWSLHCYESRQFSLIPIVSTFCHRYIQDRPFCCASFAFLFYWHLVMIFAQIICIAESKSRGKWKLWRKKIMSSFPGVLPLCFSWRRRLLWIDGRLSVLIILGDLNKFFRPWKNGDLQNSPRFSCRTSFIAVLSTWFVIFSSCCFCTKLWQLASRQIPLKREVVQKSDVCMSLCQKV